MSRLMGDHGVGWDVLTVAIVTGRQVSHWVGGEEAKEAQTLALAATGGVGVGFEVLPAPGQEGEVGLMAGNGKGLGIEVARARRGVSGHVEGSPLLAERGVEGLAPGCGCA
jgi:hypothetical protein